MVSSPIIDVSIFFVQLSIDLFEDNWVSVLIAVYWVDAVTFLAEISFYRSPSKFDEDSSLWDMHP